MLIVSVAVLFVSVANALGCFNTTSQNACTYTMSSCTAATFNNTAAACGCFTDGATCFMAAGCDQAFMDLQTSLCCDAQLGGTAPACNCMADCSTFQGTCTSPDGSLNCTSSLYACINALPQSSDPASFTAYYVALCECYTPYASCLPASGCDAQYTALQVNAGCLQFEEIGMTCAACPPAPPTAPPAPTAAPPCTDFVKFSVCSRQFENCTTAVTVPTNSSTLRLYNSQSCTCYSNLLACAASAGCMADVTNTYLGGGCLVLSEQSYSCSACTGVTLPPADPSASMPLFTCNGMQILQSNLTAIYALYDTILPCVQVASPSCYAMTLSMTAPAPTPPLSPAQNASMIAVNCMCGAVVYNCAVQNGCQLTPAQVTTCMQQCPAAQCTFTATPAPTAHKASATAVAASLTTVLIVVISLL